MTRAHILSAWVGSGASAPDARRPALLDDFPGVRAHSDVTGQPVENITPGALVVVEIVAPEATLAAIAAHPQYGEGSILWEEPEAGGGPRPARLRTDTLPAAEFVRLRTALQGKGLKVADLAAAVGAAPGGRSREDVAGAVREWLRTRPRGT